MPTRVVIIMLATTYGLSLISTPMWAIGLPTGPMLNGMTYIVRPFMHPRNSPRSVAFISSGGAQLLVGPASASCSEQMKVRSSTRATSAGSERTRMLLGRRASSSFTAVPPAIIASSIRSYCSGDPSHQTTSFGSHIAAVRSTHSSRRRWFVGAAESFGMAVPYSPGLARGRPRKRPGPRVGR